MILFVLGIVTGILSGMGVGGGILLVPVLVYFFHTPQQIAQGVILSTFLPTALVALYTHYQHGYIKFRLTVILASCAFFGALGGAWLANIMNGDILKKCFGVFLFVMGLYECFAHKKTPSTKKAN